MQRVTGPARNIFFTGYRTETNRHIYECNFYQLGMRLAGNKIAFPFPCLYVCIYMYVHPHVSRVQ